MTIKEWEYGMQINLKNKEGDDNYTIITGYNNRSSNIKKFLNAINCNLEVLEKTNDRIIIAVDLNVRIGESQGVSECGLEKVNDLPTRRSEDKEYRYEGIRFIEWCEENTMVIMNGRTKEDREGKITCIGHGENLGSVLDLVLVKTEEEVKMPVWFKGLRVAAQEGSDHLPVIYRLKWETKALKKKFSSNYHKKIKLRWKEDKEEEFENEIKRLWQESQEKEVTEGRKITEIEEKWNNIKRIIYEAANKLKMFTKGNTNNAKSESWDNGEYRKKEEVYSNYSIISEKRETGKVNSNTLNAEET